MWCRARHRCQTFSGQETAPGPAQIPPPNPTAAEPDSRRVLSRVGVADHEVALQAPSTGSGWRQYSYGGFGEATPTSARIPAVGNLISRVPYARYVKNLCYNTFTCNAENMGNARRMAWRKLRRTASRSS
jgi:hypothetical protein